MQNSGATEITIYTDGACEPNPGPGGWAAIVVRGSSEQTMIGREPQTTNNRMEITAALVALEVIATTAGDRVIVVSDSQYLVKGAQWWIAGWKRNGWRTRSKTDVLNRDLWERLDAVLQRYARAAVSVEWVWQRGHAGHAYNERCDALAVAAMQATT